MADIERKVRISAYTFDQNLIAEFFGGPVESEKWLWSERLHFRRWVSTVA